MKNVYDIMREKNADANVQNFRIMQGWDYDQKVSHAEKVARAYHEQISGAGQQCHVSVGGLDSITLHYFLEKIGISVPCISCSTLEQRGVQAAHKRIKAEMSEQYQNWYYDKGALEQSDINQIADEDEREREQALHDQLPERPAMHFLSPLKSKIDVMREFGFPVLSKEIAGKISHLQHPTEKNATVRHAIITGETGEFGGWQKDSRMKMSQIWLSRFGGADPEGAALGYKAAPFLVSDRCCYYLKEKPCDDWAKKHNSVPYLGLMASEGGRRQKSLMLNGCNYFAKGATRSAPFAIFSRQDLLQLVLDLKVPVPEEYGEIVRDSDGTLRTTLAQRTGCTMCGFGVHMEGRPHRFDRLRMSDLADWSIEARNKTASAMLDNPQHTYLFLSKRPRQAYPYINRDNVWSGTTVTCEGDLERIGYLPLNGNRFISIEPIVAAVDLHSRPCRSAVPFADWVIIGAETGRRKGKVAPQKEWVAQIAEYCAARRVPVFMKDSLVPIMGERDMLRQFPW